MGTAPRPTPTPWQGYRLFYTQFRRRFHDTGAIAPSGSALARAITAPLVRAASGATRAAGALGSAPDHAGLRVLEVGAGTGVFTAAILGHLGRGDALDIYEINPVFQPFLEARLRQAGAEAHGIGCRIHLAAFGKPPLPDAAYDFIVSGLPLNNFAPAEVETLLAQFMQHLRPGGVFSYFEYPYIRELKCALVHNAAERARLRGVAGVVHGFLTRHPNRQTLVPWNLPPAVARHVRPV